VENGGALVEKPLRDLMGIAGVMDAYFFFRVFNSSSCAISLSIFFL